MEAATIKVLRSAQWPWIAKAGAGRWNITTSRAPRTFNICAVNTDREHQEVIAHLIAAAPDLLEALVRLMPYVPTPCQPGDDEWEDDDGLHLAAVERALAAIANATHGAPSPT